MSAPKIMWFIVSNIGEKIDISVDKNICQFVVFGKRMHYNDFILAI